MAQPITFPSSPLYESEAKNLITEVEAAQTLAQIRGIFQNFAKKYTIIPELWQLWMR